MIFAVIEIILGTEGGIKQADRSVVEMALAFGALPEFLAGLRLGVIRGAKKVVIGQLLIAILGIGELFELYSQHFLMEAFWALVLIVFFSAFLVSEAVAYLARRIEYYASSR